MVRDQEVSKQRKGNEIKTFISIFSDIFLLQAHPYHVFTLSAHFNPYSANLFSLILKVSI